MERTVLIVDDNEEIVELVSVFLEREGICTVAAYNGQEAWSLLQLKQFDLALLDIMMPGMDGMELLQNIRLHNKMPVMFLSAKSQDQTKINGFRLGADDFIAKPFNPVEVAVRVIAMLRRCYDFGAAAREREPEDLEDTCLGELRLNHRECVLYKQKEAIDLTAIEYKLLRILMASPGRVFTKKQLFELAWADEYYEDANTVMVHISRLRDKLESNPRKPAYLLTVRGLGYKFVRLEGRGDAGGAT